MAKRILFFGDSITDSRRDRNNDIRLGDGYVNMVSGFLGTENPQKYQFINRGIGGDRIVDLYARIKSDFINLKPDIASIYIGVNDVWSEIDHKNGVGTAKFEKIYTMMIDEIKAELPDIKLMIIAPFILEGSGTCNIEEKPDKFERFKKGVAEKAQVAKKMAEKYSLPLIELQPAFDEANKKAPAEYWTWDGVHPTACGHEIIKRLWIETFKNIE